MGAPQLARDIRAEVAFWGYEQHDGQLAGVMGVQHVRDVTLVRHAYVRPDHQGKGIGGMCCCGISRRSPISGYSSERGRRRVGRFDSTRLMGIR
ncbi:MAG: GNAT family N-acetyltransferase [Gemmatimonadales bacterium]